jgi:alpha-beta hydrolase superfamily lysophospholipase
MHDTVTVRAVEAASEASERVRAGVASLVTPTLILHGAEDPISASSTSQALAREGIDVRIVDDGLHDLLHDAGGEELMGEVCVWIDARVPRREGA